MTDTNSNAETGTVVVTVEDNILPVVHTKDITVALDLSGQANITYLQIDDNSTDNCNIDSYILDQNVFDCSHVGSNMINLTVTDDSGNTSSSSATVTITDNLLTDYYALVELYNSTIGSNWTNNTDWLSNCDPCGLQAGNDPWFGVTCNASNRIIEISLNSNNLSGPIPPQIGDLIFLERLYLLNNQLSGVIPTEIENLTSLTYLYLSSNNLSGSIPGGLGNLPLEWLILHHNNFTGCYDAQLTPLCQNLNPGSSTNSNISDFNALDGDWEDFCNCGAAICPCGLTNIWLGGNGSWDDSSKWSLGHIPRACEYVQIITNGDLVTMPSNYSSVIYLLHVDVGVELDIPTSSKLTVLSDVLAGNWDDCTQH